MTTLSTYSGLVLSLEDPQPDQIDIHDIARGLARQARFSGQTSKFYSVAQHSVLVSRLCDLYPLDGLLHDAAEAYMSDIPRPVKSLAPALAGIEDRIYRAVARRFGIEAVMPDEVGLADEVLLVTEYRDLCPNGPRWDLSGSYPPPDKQTVQPWTEQHAMDAFLSRFEVLMARRVPA